jgi:hypothetical protein
MKIQIERGCARVTITDIKPCKLKPPRLSLGGFFVLSGTIEE